MAKLLARADRRDEAAKAYLTSLGLNPRQPDALRELGELYRFEGDFPKAEEAFHKAIALDPNNAVLHQDLGNTLLKAGENDKAEAELRQSVTLDPRLGGAHRDLGLVLREKGRFEEAVEELQRAAALLPSDSSVHYQLSRDAAAGGKNRGGREGSALSEQLGRKERESQQVLATGQRRTVAGAQGHAQEGLAKIREALQMDPANLTAHFNYALALRHLGRYDESIFNCRKCCRCSRTCLPRTTRSGATISRRDNTRKR